MMMDDKGDLATRIEAAGAEEQRVMLIEAWTRLYPEHALDWKAKADRDLWYAWRPLNQQFTKMLDASAFESAALMLVPEGWTWAYLDGRAIIRLPETMVHRMGEAATPALAIASACLRAQQENGDVQG